MTECFTIYANEFEGRIDPHFYRPEFLELEKKVAKKTNKKLGDFIISVSGGATPSRQKDDELYTDEEQGIPFLRVQNITENGLVLDDVKFITKEVHETELKRSQIKEDNLLITITGRIASSCVVPKGFEGNINQHSVVIETKDRKTAEIIATFLNSSIGHKLALRRTSGGSRLALDYKALKSIPIILNEKIVSLMENAYKEQKNKENKTSEFLDSINDYVLDELGIKLPELNDKMIYIINSDDAENKRIDAYYYQPSYLIFYKSLEKGKFKLEILSNLCTNIFQGVGKNEVEDSKFILLKVKNILKNNQINFTDVEYIKNVPTNKILKEGDIIAPFIGEAIRQFKFSVFTKKNGKFTIDNNTGIIRPNFEKINSFYLMVVLNSIIVIKQIQQLIGGGGVPFLGSENVKSIKIPLPSLPIQNKIADEVKRRMQKAEQLQKEAKEELEKAKLEVEKMILGE